MEKSAENTHTKNNKFLYTQYRDAARQHLTACRRLIDTYPEWSKICNKHDKEKIFHEIYYISGYILEGFVNFAIFCHPDWNKEDNIIKFCKPDFSNITKLYYQGSHPYIIATHNFQKNRDILDKFGYTTGIPYLSFDEPLANDRITEERLRVLISKWKPDIRYKKVGDPIDLSFSDISNLITLCKNISDGIRNNLK